MPAHSRFAPTGRRSALLRMALVTTALAALTTGCAVSVPANVQPVQNFEASRYMGQWYELARIDQRFQKGLTKANAEYSLNPDGTVTVINRGFNAAKNEWKQVEGKAKFTGPSDVGALKVSFFGPFYSGYNVVHLSPDYQTALVVGNTTDSFWLLSRKPSLPAAEIQQLLAKAQRMGVDLSQVIQAQ